jgi:hypothetical protein
MSIPVASHEPEGENLKLPFESDAEAALIGAVLNGEPVTPLRDIVRPADFYAYPALGATFQTLLDMADGGECTADPVTLMARVTQDGPTPLYSEPVLDECRMKGLAGQGAEYARLIVKASKLRQVIDSAEDLAEAAYRGEIDRDLIGRLVDLSGQIRHRPHAQPDEVMAIIRRDFRLIRSIEGGYYAEPRQGGCGLCLPLKGSGGVRQSVIKRYERQHGKIPAQGSLAAVMEMVEGDASELEPETVSLRSGADFDGSVIIDLGGTPPLFVRIRPEGWEVVDQSPIPFRRTKLTAPMPLPVAGGIITELFDILNVPAEDRDLLIGWLVAGLMPLKGHALLFLRALKGAAKSTMARYLIGLIDPSMAPLRPAPDDLKDWSVAINGSKVFALDNLSYIPRWLSDALAQVITGIAKVDRELYTNEELSIRSHRRIVILTSIDIGSMEADLAERTLLVELEPLNMDQRVDEEILDRRYEEMRPRVLGALLDLVSQVLARRDSVEVAELPRMADFGKVLATLDQIRGTASLDRFHTIQATFDTEVVEGSAVGQALLKLVEYDQGAPFSWPTLGGGKTMGGLLDDLTEKASRPLPKSWPTTPAKLRGIIDRITSSLEGLGVTVECWRSHGKRMVSVHYDPAGGRVPTCRNDSPNRGPGADPGADLRSRSAPGNPGEIPGQAILATSGAEGADQNPTFSTRGGSKQEAAGQRPGSIVSGGSHVEKGGIQSAPSAPSDETPGQPTENGCRPTSEVGTRATDDDHHLEDLARRLGALSDDAAGRIADAMDAAGWDSATDLANLEPVQIDQVTRWITEAEESDRIIGTETAAVVDTPAPTTPAPVALVRKRYRFGRRLSVFVDTRSGSGVTEDGRAFTVGPKRKRKAGATLGELLTDLPGDARRVYLCGPRPETGPAGKTPADRARAWILDELPAEWSADPVRGHYLDRIDLPVGYYRQGEDRAIEVHRAATWELPDDATPEVARAAMAAIDVALRGAFKAPAKVANIEDGYSAWLASPTTTGRELLHSSLPWDTKAGNYRSLPVLAPEHASLIRSTSPQGRLELVPGEDTLPGIHYLDQRWAYAACVNAELPIGPATLVDGGDFSQSYTPARYLVKARVPDGWDKVGILPAKVDDGESWEYPSTPGTTFDTWADPAELRVAAHYGWSFTILQTLAYAGSAKVLAGWGDALQRARASIGVRAQAGEIDPEVAGMAAAGVRQILVNGIGSLHGRPRKVTRAVASFDQVPAGEQASEHGGQWIWTETGAGAGDAFSHPELSTAIWARCRARLLDGGSGKGAPRTGALMLPRSEVVALRTDALYLTRDPGWIDGGSIGEFRVKGHAVGPIDRPTDIAELLSIKELAESESDR